MIINNTKVYLLNTPLLNDYQHTLYFGGKQEQFDYFSSKYIRKYEDFSYQRKDHIIRVYAKMDDILNCNYVMYQNPDYSDKWFYAFIKELKYIDDGRTDIIIETDVIQTWLFDYQIGTSFVEREHVDDDTIGLHTFPEQLESGEYVCDSFSADERLKEYCYVILVTEWVNGEKPLATNFGGVPSAGGAYICNSVVQVVSIIKELDSNGKGEAVNGVYMIPKKIVNNTSETLQFSGQDEPVTYEHLILKPESCNGYKPKNNKLLCFPYTYLLLSNNNGNSNIYHYENFSDRVCTFSIKGVPSIGGSIKCVPKNYKGIISNEEEGIIGGKFPTLSWSSDLYTNWLTQNGVNIGVGIGTSALSIVGGIVSVATGVGAGVGTGAIAGGVMGITNQLTQVYQQSFTPNSAKGNVNAGDINTCDKNNTFYFYKMNIKKEYAMIIDEYFTMYGYKVNRVKYPNKNHRKNFWFTKTIDCNIRGNLPQDDLSKIKNCYNTGITFWKNPSNFRNYNVDNSIEKNEII